MENKNDWDELKKWNLDRMEKQKEKFGVYPDDFTNNKTMII